MKLLSRILPVENIVLELAVTSKKRVFEQAGLLFENQHGLERAAVYESLFARERLGSTGLGQGVAIPHGRIKGLKEALAAVIRLAANPGLIVVHPDHIALAPPSPWNRVGKAGGSGPSGSGLGGSGLARE